MARLGPAKQSGTAGVSKETAAFLNGLLKDKNLSLRAQQEVQDSIKAGSTQWVDCINTGTATTFQQPASKTLVKVPKPSGRSQLPRSPPPFRPSIKTQQQIEAEQAKEPSERYFGKPGVDRQAEKDRLTNVFAYGRKGAEAMQTRAAQKAAASEAALQQKARAEPVKEQLIDQIVQEINERTGFVEVLRQQGRLTREQEAVVKAEVSQRVAELRRLGVQ